TNRRETLNRYREVRTIPLDRPRSPLPVRPSKGRRPRPRCRRCHVQKEEGRSAESEKSSRSIPRREPASSAFLSPSALVARASALSSLSTTTQEAETVRSALDGASGYLRSRESPTGACLATGTKTRATCSFSPARRTWSPCSTNRSVRCELRALCTEQPIAFANTDLVSKDYFLESNCGSRTIRALDIGDRSRATT